RDGRLPVVDVFFTRRQTTNAQVAKFDAPNVPNGFQDLRLSAFGVRAEYPFTVSNRLDATLGGTLEYDRRFGLLESQPDSLERLLTWQANGAVSRFLGPDKITATALMAHQAITTENSAINPD